MPERYLEQIEQSFQQTIHLLRLGDSSEANTSLAKAVDELLSFVQWYFSLLSKKSSESATSLESFHNTIDGLQEVCEHLVELNMSESTVVLGDTLESQLIPRIGELQTICQQVKIAA